MSLTDLIAVASTLDAEQLETLTITARAMSQVKNDTEVKWRVLTPELLVTRAGILTREQAVRQFDLSTVVRTFGTWAVTTHGVECLVMPYDISFRRVHEMDWETHVPLKPWVCRDDFVAALDHARDLWANLNQDHKYRKRYYVLKRDQFRCKLCGLSALDGAKLEVDHKHPKSKGGSDADENLWTLCQQCNSGKSDLGL